MASGLQIEMLDDIDDYSDLSPKEYINAWVKLLSELRPRPCYPHSQLPTMSQLHMCLEHSNPKEDRESKIMLNRWN